MKIYGRDIKFARTIQATCAVANLCKDGDTKNLDKLFDGKYQVSQLTAARFMVALSEGYETQQTYIKAGYEPHPLTEGEALSLTEDVFSDLFLEAIDAWTGERPTIEVEEPKGKKKATAKQ